MVRLNRRRRQVLGIAALTLLIVVLVVPTASAFDGRGGEVVLIGADEVIEDDLYVGASEFTLNGTVKGDVFAGGGTIVINGTVEGDLVAAGQRVVVNGTVRDDARIAGWALTVDGEVADDLLAFGFSLETESKSKVGGGLVFGGFQALLAGDVAGDATANGNAVQLSGRIGGDLAVDVDGAQPGQAMPPGFPFAPNMPPVPSVPSGLTLTESADVGGNLDYTAAAEVTIPSGVVAGRTSFSRYVAPEAEAKAEAKQEPTLAARVLRWFVRQVGRLITLLLIGAVMMWLVPAWTHKTAGIVRKQPLPSLGWGVMAVAAFLVAMTVIACVTAILFVVLRALTLRQLANLLGTAGLLDMSIAAFVFGVAYRYVTRIIIGVLLGQLVFELFKSRATRHRWWPMLLGVFLYAVVTAIPVLGWLAAQVATLFGLGAIWIWVRDWWTSRKAAEEPAAVAAPLQAPPAATEEVVEAKGPLEPPGEAGEGLPADEPGQGSQE